MTNTSVRKLISRGGLTFLVVAVIGIFPRKPCYDGATTSAEKTLGSGGRFWLVSHILSYQHTKTGNKMYYLHS